MNAAIGRLLKNASPRLGRRLMEEEQLKRQIAALLGILSHIYGRDKLVMKATKLEALELMRSQVIEEKVLALERLVFEDPTIESLPRRSEIPGIIEELEEELADLLARRTVEERIERRISEKMQKYHEDYVRDLKAQVLKEDSGPDNAQTLRKYAELEKLEERKLACSVLDRLRPTDLREVIGQDSAIRALLSKIASPFPQHVILYGPPGVGKTTVARLVLEEAKKLDFTPFKEDARFVEVDGATLRWDPREITNPLLGSVHDPIYQGARRDLAEGGIPEPKPGLVTEAHGGVLFIDEIGELEPLLLNKLLKVLEDKRVTFESAYYDPDDPRVPKYIKKLFEEGAPADFVLIGATTREPSEINPAIRSRCAEVFFEPLTSTHIQTIVRDAASRLGIQLEEGVPELISDYTVEGRKATNILADAYGLALYQRGCDPHIGTVRVLKDDVLEVIRSSRLVPNLSIRASDSVEVGRVFGLGVMGFIGSLIEIEAVAFPSADKGKGQIRFNETAGSMARDAVFNAASVFRLLTGKDIGDFDIHVNVVGGGLIDGPSAGVAVFIAILSAIEGKGVRQDVAITGEISIRGRVKPVGGIVEKIYGARQAGMKKVIIPEGNATEVPGDLRGLEVIPCRHVSDVLPHVFGDSTSVVH